MLWLGLMIVFMGWGSILRADFTYTTSGGTATITGYEGTQPFVSLTVPSSINGFPVTAIGSSAFANFGQLSSVTLPSSLTRIGDNAFLGCTSLTSITIPANVNSISEVAFISCTKLASFAVSSSNSSYTAVGGVLFNKVQNTLVRMPSARSGSYTIPNSVTIIQGYAFQACGNLTDVIVPSTVTYIGGGAFAHCSKLASINIPASVTIIGGEAFWSCGKLTTLTIPASVTTIGTDAFGNCAGMTAITVSATNPNYASSDGVLFNKARTTLIYYPGGKAGAYVIPESVTSVAAYAFRGSWKVTEVTIPDSVTSLGIGAFSSSELTRVIIGSGVTALGNNMFLMCRNLKEVTIPAGINQFGFQVFAYCAQLTSVTFLGDAPVIGSNIFREITSSVVVYYFHNAAGFTSPTWNTYQTVNLGVAPPIERWLLTHGWPRGTIPTTQTTQDGVHLLMVYALDIDPKKSASHLLPRPVLAEGRLSMTYYSGRQDVTYTVETSTDLQSWTTADITVSSPDADSLRTASILTTTPRRFLRLSVSQ